MDARSPDLTSDALETGLPGATGWRADAVADLRLSLPEVNRTIAIPTGGHWVRRLLAFARPGYLVSVGYMDPGNLATDLAGGAEVGDTLLSGILLSHLMAGPPPTPPPKIRLVTPPHPPPA